MSDFPPTDEQAAAVELFKRGESMVIEAGAGTGKTATLELIAESTDRPGQYMAFNKAIAVEAGSRMPSNVVSSTAHSLAFQAVGKQYARRLRGARLKSNEIASRLGIRQHSVRYGKESKTLAAGFLAGKVMQGLSVFCRTDLDVPEAWMIPYIDGIDPPDPVTGKRTYRHNTEIREKLFPALERAWIDIENIHGILPFKHEHYLKIWQLSGPIIGADFILFDEAQDANPVMAAIVAAQDHAQKVYVGDSQQAIYEWTGAINALAGFDTEHRTFLTRSFRFGEAVADTANLVLELLDADLRLRGFDQIPSTVGHSDEPDAILCRTNAAAIDTILERTAGGKLVHLVGKGTEIIDFAKAVDDLTTRGKTYHPDLACFSSWEEVQRYVTDDPQGEELSAMVRLVDKYGVPTIRNALAKMPSEDDADIVVSTAHKAKGRQWPVVQLAGDFRPFLGLKPGKDPEPATDSELRLLYVALTRAQLQLDDTQVRSVYAPEEAAA